MCVCVCVCACVCVCVRESERERKRERERERERESERERERECVFVWARERGYMCACACGFVGVCVKATHCRMHTSKGARSIETYTHVLRGVAVFCSGLQCVPLPGVLQCVAVYYSHRVRRIAKYTNV